MATTRVGAVNTNSDYCRKYQNNMTVDRSSLKQLLSRRPIKIDVTKPFARRLIKLQLQEYIRPIQNYSIDNV